MSQVNMLSKKALALRHFSHRGPTPKAFWEKFGFLAFVGSLYLVAFTPAAIMLSQEKKAGYPRRGMMVNQSYCSRATWGKKYV